MTEPITFAYATERGDYEAEVKEKLGKSVLLRHLFSRIGKEVELLTDGGQVTRGILKSLDLRERFFEIEAKGVPNTNTFFISWRYVIYLQSESYRLER